MHHQIQRLILRYTNSLRWCVWPCKKLVSTFGRLRAAYYSRCKWFEYHDNLVHRITMDD